MNRDRVLGMGRLALVRLRRHRAMSIALALGIMVTVALTAAVSLLEAATAEAGLQETLSGLGPDGFVAIDQQNLTGVGPAKFSAEPGYRYFVTGTRQAVAGIFGPLLRPGWAHVETEDYQAYPVSGEGTAVGQVHLAVYDDLDRHVRYVEGSAAAAPPSGQDVDVTASADAARGLGLSPGGSYCFLKVANVRNVSYEAGEHFCARLAGVWRPLDASDPYWAGLPPPASALTLDAGPYFQLLQLLPATRSTGFVVFAPDLSRIHEAQAADLVDRFRRLRATISLGSGSGDVSTRLDSATQDFEARLQLGRFAIELVLAQLLLIALYYVAFVSGHALEQQRHVFTVWRSRGWSWHSIWRLLIAEALVLAAVAAPLGLAVGWVTAVGLARLVFPGRVAWLPPVSVLGLLAAVGAALLAALAVVAVQAALSSRRELLDERRRASRPALRGWWQWRSLDLALALLAVPLLVAAQLLGQGRVREQAGTSADVLVIALPGIAIFLIGLALLRLLSLAGRAFPPDHPSLTAGLAGLQLRRRPVQHAGLALLLLVTIALGVFASAYASTAPQSAADRVAYATGSDVRVHLTSLPPDLAGALGALHGVEAASAVYRSQGSAERSAFQPTLLAVDPYSFSQVTWDRPGLNPSPLPRLVEELADRERGGLTVPGRPALAGIWAFSTGLDDRLSLDVVDAAGRPGRAALGTLDFTGWRHLEAPLVFSARPVAYPLRIRGLAVEPVAGGLAGGQLGLSELTVRAGGQSPPDVVDLLTGSSRQADALYWWATLRNRTDRRLFAPPGFQFEGRPAVELEVGPDAGPIGIRPPPSYGPVPALAPGSTMQRWGLRQGQVITLDVDSVGVQFVIAGQADHVPTLYPETEDFLVADQAPLLDAVGYRGGDALWPAEAWVRVQPGADAADLATLRSRPDVDSASDRRQAEAEALHDPLLLQLESHLLMGFTAALALAVVGFVVHFLVTVRSRLGEMAILQSNGLARRHIARSLALEQGLLLGFAAVAGAAMGLGLAWTLIPSLQLGTDITTLVPGTVVRVDPAVTGGAVAAVALLALAAGQLGGRAAGRYRLTEVLRLL